MAKTPESVTETTNETVDPVTTAPETADPVTTAPETADPGTAAPETADPVTTAPETAGPVAADPAHAPDPVEATTWATEAELRAMLATIEARNSDLHRAQLVEYLTADYHLTFGKTGEWGVPYVRLMGIEAQSNFDDQGSLLAVWCMKARQAIMAGDVAPEPLPGFEGEAPLFQSERGAA